MTQETYDPTKLIANISQVQVMVSKVSNLETSALHRRSIARSNLESNANLVDRTQFG